MARLVACPFCREMFERSEAEVCPECGLPLSDITKLPKSALHDHDEEQPPEPVPPELERLPFVYWRRQRGPLVLVSALGMAAFFLPWLRESAPELRELSGFAFAQKLSWMWAPFVGFLVMLPMVLTRRSVHAMRGARLAIALLAIVVITTVILRLAVVPESTRLRPRRFEWTWGIYATLVLGLAALGLSTRFGGRLDDLDTSAHRRDEETLH